MEKRIKVLLLVFMLNLGAIMAQQKNIKPQDDFYTYINNDWMESTEIPDE